MNVSQPSSGLFDLHGRVGLSTDGTGGLGRAIAGVLTAQVAPMAPGGSVVMMSGIAGAFINRQNTAIDVGTAIGDGS